MSTLAFFQTVATYCLLVWEPTRLVGRGLRLLIFCVSGFVGGILLLAGLFTMWWKPAQPFLVLWPALTLLILIVIMAREEFR